MFAPARLFLRGCIRETRYLPSVASSRSSHTISEDLQEYVNPVVLRETITPTSEVIGYVSRSWERLPITRPPREAWIESWVDDYCPLGILPLNSYVFAHPVDIWCIQKNVHWQHNLRRINWTFAKNRKEMRGGGRKPWPQKGTGRARAGSIRAPHFINGGAGENAPRGPNSFYVPIEEKDKIAGLCSVLSAKFAQDDIRIVPDLHVPSDSPKFMHDLMERRKWGVSALLVDDTDEFPENITKICNEIDQVNIMPVYGLNIIGMLRHESLVLTRRAAAKIEGKILDKMFSKTLNPENKPIPLDYIRRDHGW